MTESRIRGRMRFLAGLVAFMFAAIVTRLWFLQVLASEQFSKMADENQVRLVPLAPLRGRILDRTGRVLVGNRPSTVVLVDRREMGSRQEEVLFRLSNLLRVPVRDLVDRLNSVKYLPYQPVPVAEDVPKEVVFYIEEHKDQFPGVSYQVAPVRSYPYGSLAAHVLGWVGEISDQQLREPQFRGYRPGAIVGKSGIEAEYERYLYGKDGTREIQVNAQGRVLDENFGGTPPVQGDDVVLTLDASVQKLAEQSLQLGIELARHTVDSASGTYLKATGGAAIVMNPRTGEVLAMASSPTFDPSIFLGGLTYREALSVDLCFPRRPCPKQPVHHTPLLNRAIQGLYPAGSTFKPFVAAAALREGIASPTGSYDCPAGYQAPIDPTHHVFHNWSPHDYGYMSLATALVVSCDTVFYQFGYQFWLRYHRSGDRNELMQRDLRRMGFGRRTGIDLPGEQPGVVPDYAYVKRVFASAPKVYGRFYGWLPGDAINLSIGQGYLLVTPVQLAVAYSALANGGTLVRPHLVKEIETPDGTPVRRFGRQVRGHLPIPRSEVDYLRDAMKGVPVSGTAAAAFAGFPLDRIPVAGKTGTADIIPQQPYSWFAAMAPADHPRYVVVAMVEQGGHGATTAAPIVRRILEGLFGLKPSAQLRAGAVVD